MKQNKNTITLVLMISSIALLILLEGFWLKNSYEKAYFDFRREFNMGFSSTAVAMSDDMFIKNFKVVNPDSIQTINFRGPEGDSTFKTFIAADSVISYVNVEQKNRAVHVVVSGTNDSLKRNVLKPLETEIRRFQLNGRSGMKTSYVVRLSPDTLKIDSLKGKFQKLLSQIHFNGDLFILHNTLLQKEVDHEVLPGMMKRRMSRPGYPNNNIFSDTLKSEPTMINPVHEYRAEVIGMRSFLFKEIAPQLIFSLFLTAITTAAFVFMYRNIKAQQRLMDAKNEFISNVTHELKTPVATVSVALEALKNFRALDNPKLTEDYLDIARRELDRLTVMTDKILSASIYESRGVSFTPEVINLDKSISNMMSSMKMVFEKAEADVTYETQGDNFAISGGAIHLTNVIYNLVDNALKYSQGKPVIDIHLKEENQKLILMVTDKGVGIPPEYQKKIFEKFFRVPAGDVHNAKGYGLGLSYVASVVKSHNGTIDVDSRPGEGSTFTITLPKSFKKD